MLLSVQGGSEGLAQITEFPDGYERESHTMKGVASAKAPGPAQLDQGEEGCVTMAVVKK